MRSWKTTISGLAAILAAVAHVLTNLANGEPVDFTIAIAGITSGIGLMFARDNNKTSEEVGADKK